MSVYVMLSSLTPDGSKTLHTNPDRLEEVNREIEKLGCKVLSQYALLGEYDFVTIVEAPDNATAGHLSVDLSSRGTVTIKTLPAMTIEEFRGRLSGPDQIGHS